MAEMNPLRCRMIEDMKVRNLSPATQRSSPPGIDWHFVGVFQRRRLRPAFFLRRHPRAFRDGRSHPSCTQAAATACDPERGRQRPHADPGRTG